MRYVVATVAALAGLLGAAGSAQAQGFAPRCPQACPCSCGHNWTKYSGCCNYPEQRAMPPDPWGNRCGRGAGNGAGNRDMMWSRYLRSPRDFWMTGGCYPNCR